MDANKIILREIRDHIDDIILGQTAQGISLWNAFIKVHPADIARILTDLDDEEEVEALFKRMPQALQLLVFEELSTPVQAEVLSFLYEPDKIDALNRLPADELTDLFEYLSDEDLKKYLQLLHKTARHKVLSLMQFHPESAGGIMDTEVLTLRDEFTVQKSVALLQRLRPSREIYQLIYVTNRDHILRGYIHLEDLVFHAPSDRIASFMKPIEYTAKPTEDREEVAQAMVHYSLMSVPVIDQQSHLLGVIQSDTLVDVLVEEAGEDVQKMSALVPLKYPYFETSFFRILYKRSYILLALFIAQSFSTTIMRAYETTLHGILLLFTTMLISTGGNASNQTSAVAIQGMATGDINRNNMYRFIRREFMMGLILALIFGLAAFTRGYLTTHTIAHSAAIAFSQSLIILVSVSIGSCVPIILKFFNIDPAFAAGPFLATCMDIIGILIYCLVTQFLVI